MRSVFDKVRQELNRLQGEERKVQNLSTIAKAQVKDLFRKKRRLEQAQAVVQEVAQITQKQLQYKISELASLAIAIVFPDDPYELEVEFVQRRGKTEADIWFVRQGQRVEPLGGSGGGVVDVAAFALRVAVWSLYGQLQNVLVLDEPFKHVKGEGANERVLIMLQKICKEIGLQIIMVSDERVSREVIEQYADKIIVCTKESGKPSIIIQEG
ncbi:hypothetical protein LCGC14_0957550 [marine sediment metagenome]|uniref:RecF/RecN/SMC N-terminal domain-containing protein n=1 Tax=marine sediment metagenome TaxID=412755 RepID=A0A0F9QYV5_9ZZZZ